MFYNIKNEKIYYISTASDEAHLNVILAGITLPNPNYIIAHNISSANEFDRYQFEYVTNGVGYIIIDGKTTKIQKGDFFFINKYSPRIFYSDEKDPLEKMFITVNGSLVEGLVQAFDMSSPLVVSQTDVSENFENILNVLENCKDNRIEAYEAVGVELLKILQKVNRGKNHAKEKGGGCRAENIMNYIDQNIYRKFSLDELSDYFYLSKTQIIRLFKEKYRVSPMQYAITKRIALSMYYLSKTKISISALAEMLTFSDSKHFSKTFKKIVDQTPSEYRKSTFEIQKKTIENLLKSINK